MAEGSKSREMLNYAFLNALADDGVIDENELLYIKNLALADGILDEAERSAMKRIIALVDENNLSATARKEFTRFLEQYEL